MRTPLRNPSNRRHNLPFLRLAGVVLLPAVALFIQDLFSKTNYKKWLDEEVIWVISEKEREAFRSLKSDVEREEFIRRFWERRDPTPSTPRNEYKEEHYRRYEYTLKNLQEDLPGWKTDRGRIYILHGPPDREDFYTANPRMNTEGRADVARERTPNTIVWTYRQNAHARYYRGEVALVFQPSSGLSRQNLMLGESRTAQEKADQLNRQLGPAIDQSMFEADVRYRLIVAGPSALVTARGAAIPKAGVGESARYIEDLIRSPGDALEEMVSKSDLRETARRELREAVEARLSFGTLPLALTSRRFFEENGSYRLEVQLDIPADELAQRLNNDLSAGKERVELYCSITTAQGEIADESLDSIEISPESLRGQHLHYLNSFVLLPGTYTLKAAVRNSGRDRIGYREESVQLLAPPAEGIQISDLRVTDRVEPASSATSQESEPAYSKGSIRFGEMRLLPKPEAAFKNSDTLFIFVQILLPPGKKLQDCALSVGMSFIGEEGIVKRVEARRIEESNSRLPGIVHFATAVRAADLPAGKYRLQVQAIDHFSKRFSIQRTALEVIP